MVRVSWLLAALLALWLSAPALAQPIRLTDGPPKTVAQQKAEAEALERAQEEAAWKAFEEAEARYKEVRAANADKIEAYDDAIEAWRKANPAPAGTKESLISQSVDYETALYESTTITYFNKYNIPTHSITFGPDAKPTGPVTLTQQGKAWETIGPQLVPGGVFGISYGQDFDGNEIITRIQIGDEHGYRTAEMEFNFEGIAWRTEYWGEDGKRRGGQLDDSRRPPPRTMGGPLDVPKIWRVITQPCEQCRARTERYNVLADKANGLINLMAEQSRLHERAWPEAQKPIKLRFNYLKRQLDALTPDLEAARAEALECHKICRPAEKPDQAVLTSPPAGKLPAPDLTRPSLIPVAKLEPPASFCDEFARVAYMNEVYTPAAKASLANAQTASAHLGKLGGMFTDYMKNEGGPGWAAVRAEQEAYGPIAQTATDDSNAINAMYQRVLAIPIVPCPDSKPRVATGDPAPAPALPATDGVAVIPARAADGKKPCPPKQGRKPIVVGPNSKVGSGAQLTKKLGGMLVGGLLGAAGVGGGGGGGEGPTLYKCRIKDSEMTVFSDPVTGVSLKVGAKRGKGDVVNVFANIAKSPDKGTFQTAFMERGGDHQVQAPFDVGPCDLWGEWKLTVSWTRDTYVDGELVKHESGGWSEGGKFSIPGVLSKEGAPTGMWKQMGFSNASNGAREAFMAFNVAPGGGPNTFIIHVTRPGGDPVTTVPFILTMTETAPGVFGFTQGEAEPDCPDPVTTTYTTDKPIAGLASNGDPAGEAKAKEQALDEQKIERIIDSFVADDLKLIDQLMAPDQCDPTLRARLIEQLRERLRTENDDSAGSLLKEAAERDEPRTQALLDWLSEDPEACRPPGQPPKPPPPAAPRFDPAPAPYTPQADDAGESPDGGQTQDRPKEAPLPPPDTRVTAPTLPPQGPPRTYEPTTRAPGERWQPAMPEKYRSLKGSTVNDLRKLQDLFELLHKADGDRAANLEKAAQTCQAGGYIDPELSWWTHRDRWRDSLMLTLGLIDTAKVEGPQAEEIKALLDAERFSVKEMLDTIDGLQEPRCGPPTLPPSVDAPPESILDSIEEVFVPA